MKKLSTLKNKLWKLVSEYVRRKDADSKGYVPCYTCGTWKHWKELDAGHGIGGRKNAVLFDLTLIRPQCKKCNMPPGCGMYYEFGTKLNQEYGEGWYEQRKIEANKPVKISRSDYIEMINYYQQRINELA